MTRTVILDAETDALHDYKKCWVVVCRDLDTDEVATFRHIHEAENAEALSRYLSSFDCCVGHNLLGFDVLVLNRMGVKLPDSIQLIDTLILSRLLNYNQEGGHSLEAWGKRFGFPKDTFSDFSQWSEQLEARCVVDTLLTKRLYNTFSKYLKDTRWKKPIELEHKVATLCNTLSTNGFTFNYNTSIVLKEELKGKVEALKDSFASVFPPKSVLIKEITPKATKSGALHAKDFKWLDSKDLTPFSVSCSFSLFEYVPFNPNSPTQVVARLNEAGWKPIEKTKGHIEAERRSDVEALKKLKETGWKISEANLATLPETAPEAARKLAEYLLLSSRLGDLEEWINLYNPETGKIHGQFNGIGSWTHRKSHQRPNMANIPALTNRTGKPQPYGAEFRSLWTASKGRILVGCDAEGIQLRLFAHYCNDRRLVEAIVNGKKEDGTDIHSLNKRILDTTCNSRELCRSREVAKTYIYALLLGAGKAKQAQILDATKQEAQRGFDHLIGYYPGWDELRKGRLREDGERGYFEGLDGRLVITPSAHHVLAGYLQNGESVVMKMASLLWHEELRKRGVPFWFVNDVHDEWQTETLLQHAEFVGQIQAWSIKKIGEELGLNCPLAGKYVIGNNWKETH
jgi:DNA polymerase-1